MSYCCYCCSFARWMMLFHMTAPWADAAPSILARTKALTEEALVRTIAVGSSLAAKEGLARKLSAGDLSREKPFARLLRAVGPAATLLTIPAILTFCSCGLCNAWAREQGCVVLRLKSR